MKGGRRQGRQRKRWEDNIREWTGLEFGKALRQWRTGKMEKTSCKIIFGAPTTLVVKDLIMMMMRLVPMLYFFMVAHKAACKTLSKAFWKSMKIW